MSFHLPDATPPSAPSGNASFLHETFVLPREQMGFNLAGRIQGNAHHDQEGRPPVKRDVEKLIRMLGRTQTAET